MVVLDEGEEPRRLIRDGVFFEIRWEDRHIFVDAGENDPAGDLRIVMKAFMERYELATAKFVRPADRNHLETNVAAADVEWVLINESKTVRENGYCLDDCTRQAPATIGLLFEGEKYPNMPALAYRPPLPSTTMLVLDEEMAILGFIEVTDPDPQIRPLKEARCYL